MNLRIPNHRYKKLAAHVKAREIKRTLPRKIYSNFFKFAFVRNPWDWQVSLYHYMLQTPDHFQHELVQSMGDFDTYITWRVNQDKHLQSDFVLDENGQQIVDFIGKYEQLTEDFAKISNSLNLNVQLPHANRSNHSHFQEYYSKKSRILIEQHFQEDIEFFGYSFDS